MDATDTMGAANPVKEKYWSESTACMSYCWTKASTADWKLNIIIYHWTALQVYASCSKSKSSSKFLNVILCPYPGTKFKSR